MLLIADYGWHKTGALVAVGHTCVRKQGQPEAINWTVDTEGNDCPLKEYFSSSRAYRVKIYNSDDLEPKKEDEKKYCLSVVLFVTLSQYH
ncbi:MAG: hypothetical protein ABII22_06540 [Candidatus Micrarchaeota archaeon]